MAPSGSPHQLEFLSGPLQGRLVPLQPTTVVGRLAGECDLVVADASVSRRHARLEPTPEGLRIVDEGSRNGVWLGARRVGEALVRSGEEFKLGEVRARYHAPQAIVAEMGPELPLEELDLELPELDLPELDQPTPSAPPARPPAKAPPASETIAPVAATPTGRAPAAGRPERASAAATRGILQYSRHEGSSGLAQGDFAQLPGWLKAGAIVLALAVFALVFALAFRGGAWLRGSGAGAAAEAEGESATEDG